MKNKTHYDLLIEKIKKDLKILKYQELANRIGITYINLYRIATERSKGNRGNWEKIEAYYK